MVCDNLDWTTLFWWLEDTRTSPQKHHHKNTTTQTPPHHHKNTSTRTPPQERKNTTTKTLQYYSSTTKYTSSTTPYYKVLHQPALSVESGKLESLLVNGRSPQLHTTLRTQTATSQVPNSETGEWPNPTRWSLESSESQPVPKSRLPKSLDDNKIFCFFKIWTTSWSPDIWQRNRSSNNRRDVVSFELRIFNQLVNLHAVCHCQPLVHELTPLCLFQTITNAQSLIVFCHGRWFCQHTPASLTQTCFTMLEPSRERPSIRLSTRNTSLCV